MQAPFLPLPLLLPHLLPKGGDCGGRVGWGWMQFQPQSRAPWLEAIFSLGPQACLPVGSQPLLPSCKTAPHRPPYRPLTRTGNHMCTSRRGYSGVTAVGPGAGEVLVQSPPLRRPRSRSRFLTQLLDVCFRLLHPPCLPLIEWIPNPMTERAGWGNQSSAEHTTTGKKAPSALWPISFWLSRDQGKQMGSRETAPSPSPKAAPSGGWSPAREGNRGPVRGGSVLHRHMWLDLKSY